LERVCAGCGGVVERLRTVEVCGRPRLDDRDSAGETLSSVLMSSISSDGNGGGDGCLVFKEVEENCLD